MIFKALAILVGILIFGIPWGKMGLLIAVPVEIGLFMLAYKLWEMSKK